jgi:hypothetical protein
MVISMITTASAIEEILDGFNLKYNTSKTRLDTCDLCHVPGQPKKPICKHCQISGEPENGVYLNSYGLKIKENLNMDMDQAFGKLENLDSDNDGSTNIEEIHSLTFPGDKKDKPKKMKNNVLSTKSLEFIEIIRSIFK